MQVTRSLTVRDGLAWLSRPSDQRPLLSRFGDASPHRRKPGQRQRPLSLQYTGYRSIGSKQSGQVNGCIEAVTRRWANRGEGPVTLHSRQLGGRRCMLPKFDGILIQADIHGGKRLNRPGQLPRQRCGKELLPVAQARTRQAPNLPKQGSDPQRCLPLHRDVLQPTTTSRHCRRPVSGRVRTNSIPAAQECLGRPERLISDTRCCLNHPLVENCLPRSFSHRA